MKTRTLLHLNSKLISCACGCGESIHEINTLGKPARFKTHHNIKTFNYPTNWKGGIVIESHGYRMIKVIGHPKATKLGDYVIEHVLVMEEYFGRYLKDNEIVHHKNGIRTDNRIENLELMTRGKHTTHHNIIRWNREVKRKSV